MAKDTQKHFFDVGPAPYDSAYIAIDNELQALENKMFDLRGNLPKTNDHYTEAQKKQITELREQFGELFGKADEAHFAAQENRERTLESLGKYRETIKRDLRRSTILGYAFYAIGWFVNLIGGFFGLKPTEEG
jgi:hypothetical protein